MSTKERINTILDGFSEEMLLNALTMLESLQKAVDEAADEAYCQRLYDDYRQNPEPIDEMMDIEDFAKELGIVLE